MKKSGRFSFFRQGDKINVRMTTSPIDAFADAAIRSFAGKDEPKTVEERIQDMNYDLSAPMIVLTAAEYRKLEKFLPDPLPANVAVAPEPGKMKG